MNSIKMTYIDLLKIKFNKLVVIVFLGFVVWLQYKTNDPTQVLLYTLFGAVIFSMQPFLLEQSEESGFINMLPYSKKERVTGRYLYGMLLALIGVVYSIINVVIYYKGIQNIPIWFILLLSVELGIALIFITVEYSVSYIVGKFKSRQISGLLCMIPGFLFFFGGSFVFEHMGLSMRNVILWAENNILLCSALFLLGSIIFFVVGIEVSYSATKNRDLA